MHGELFTLVSAEDPTRIFAWGMQITEADTRTAIVWRRDPENGQNTFGVHASAEAARRRFGLITPMEVVWESAALPTS